MKNAAIVVALLVAFTSGLFFYGNFPRDRKIAYEDLQLTELHEILCIEANGNARTFVTHMPSFEGFSIEDTKDLENQYAQSFCDSI